ncbi:hypothetical protein GCM10023186_15670 [Hymenobacter koreensis]|uniref:T9SS type A sorting domain-containing protein n=2 Tax=Hymenobacter koreensis TaxID=1084523 RepID=A0ABP8IY39_9BACT
MVPGAGALAQQPAPVAERTSCLLLPLDVAERAARVPLVVEGEVVAQTSFWDQERRRIYTANTVRAYKLLKGNLPGGSSELTIITEGGTVGYERHELTNTLELQIGTQGVLFLESAPFPNLPATMAGSWAAYASQQGFVRYSLADLSAAEPFRTYAQIDAAFYRQLLPGVTQAPRELAPNAALAAAQARKATAGRGVNVVLIATLSPTTLSAGTGAVLTIRGSGFGPTTGSVAFRNADDGGATFTPVLGTDILSWSDTQIQVRVPSYSAEQKPAGTGNVRVTTSDGQQGQSPTPVTIVFAQSNVQETNTKEVVPTDHFNQNGNGGYSFRYDPGFAQNAPAAQSFQRALAQWRCQTTINWEVGATRTSRGVSADNVNAVEFDQGSELPARVLGRTTSYYSGCRSTTGQLLFWVREIDMQFDDGINWQFGPAPATGGQFDFETVAVHELGHGHQLSHIIRPGAVMHFAVANGQNQRTLNRDSDINGGRTILRTRSFVADACGPAPMQPAPLVGALQSVVNEGAGVRLTWVTRDECNVQSFVLERSADNQTWQTVAQVPATPPAATYSRFDSQPLPGLSYYRLRVVLATDGESLAAPSVPVRAQGGSARAFQVFPNPTAGATVQLEYVATAPGDLVVRFYDAVGRYRGGQRLQVQQVGLNQLSITLPANLRAGWYALRWEGPDQKGTLPIIKLE